MEIEKMRNSLYFSREGKCRKDKRRQGKRGRFKKDLY